MFKRTVSLAEASQLDLLYSLLSYAGFIFKVGWSLKEKNEMDKFSLQNCEVWKPTKKKSCNKIKHKIFGERMQVGKIFTVVWMCLARFVSDILVLTC